MLQIMKLCLCFALMLSQAEGGSGDHTRCSSPLGLQGGCGHVAGSRFGARRCRTVHMPGNQQPG